MTKKTYSWTSNGAMVLAIASAFLYDSGRVSHTFAIALGVVAGAIAIIIYFSNQASSFKPEYELPKQGVVSKQTPAPNDEPATVESSSTRQIALHTEERLQKLQQTRARLLVDANVLNRIVLESLRGSGGTCEEAVEDAPFRWLEGSRYRYDVWMKAYTLHNDVGRRMKYHFPADKRLMTPEVELSPKETAACALEIIRKLAIEDRLNEWEYLFDAKGLRVSSKRLHHARVLSAQEEFCFGDAEVHAG